MNGNTIQILIAIKHTKHYTGVASGKANRNRRILFVKIHIV